MRHRLIVTYHLISFGQWGGGLDIGLRYRGRVILKLGLKCLKNRKAKRENYVNKEGRKKGKGKGD